MNPIIISHKLKQVITETWVYISLLSTNTFFLFPFCITHTTSILNYPDITWLAQHNGTHFKTHLITCTTLNVLSRIPSTTCSCIVMLTPWMLISFQLTAMAPMGSHKAKWNATARAKIPTSVINRCQTLHRDRLQGYISQHICGLMQIFNISSVYYGSEWYLFYDISLCDPVMTSHFPQFWVIGLNRRRTWLPFWEWLVTFHSCMQQMFDKTSSEMNNWRWVNAHTFGDQVNHSNVWATSLRMVEWTGQHYSRYSSDDIRALIEPACCQK